MGALVEDVSYAVEYFGGDWWHAITISRGGNSALHTGIAWPCEGPHDDTGPMAALIATATDGETAFGEALDELSTQTGGPFPGVDPATWWSGLTSTRKAAVVAQGAAWANAGKMP